MYEQKLKAQNPSHRNITYDISDLFFFIDSLGDLSCLGEPVVALLLLRTRTRTRTRPRVHPASARD
jgi:hypothetical protein